MPIRRWAPIAFLVAVVIAIAGLLAARATARGEVREVVLVARGMSYYAAGSGPNPTITIRPGERVRFVLRNETPGMLHDLVVAGLNVAIDPIPAGGTGSVELQAPKEAGRHEYFCRPHSVMMRGVVEVR